MHKFENREKTNTSDFAVDVNRPQARHSSEARSHPVENTGGTVLEAQGHPTPAEWIHLGDDLLEEERFDRALRAFKRGGARERLLELGNRLMSIDGMLFLAEDAYIAAGRNDKLETIGDHYAAEGLVDSAKRLYAAAQAWDKLAKLNSLELDRGD